MIGVTKVELFEYGSNGQLNLSRTILCRTGKISVEWTYSSFMFSPIFKCAEVYINNDNCIYFTGSQYKRAKFYFENGYIWDTLLKPTDEWRKMIYDELKIYVDSNYNILPGSNRSEMSKAAQLLDDEMQYEI